MNAAHKTPPLICFLPLDLCNLLLTCTWSARLVLRDSSVAERETTLREGNEGSSSQPEDSHPCMVTVSCVQDEVGVLVGNL